MHINSIHFNFLIHRLTLFPLAKDRCNRKLENIKEIAVANGYNVSVLNKILTKYIQTKTTTLTCIKHTILDKISITYYPKMVNKLNHTYRKCGM